jgi:hypothetical protein
VRLGISITPSPPMMIMTDRHWPVEEAMNAGSGADLPYCSTMLILGVHPMMSNIENMRALISLYITHLGKALGATKVLSLCRTHKPDSSKTIVRRLLFSLTATHGYAKCIEKCGGTIVALPASPQYKFFPVKYCVVPSDQGASRVDC